MKFNFLFKIYRNYQTLFFQRFFFVLGNKGNATIDGTEGLELVSTYSFHVVNVFAGLQVAACVIGTVHGVMKTTCFKGKNLQAITLKVVFLVVSYKFIFYKFESILYK